MAQTVKFLDSTSLRDHARHCSKQFKSSWVELGRVLYSIWKDKSYKEWGYSTFDLYTAKEIGIRKQTSLKLLRSYYFLEKEEPQYLHERNSAEGDAEGVPSYESVDVLRRAKNNKTIDSGDYIQLRKNVLDKGKDVCEVRKDLTALIRQREELEPEEAWAKKKEGQVKRLMTTLKNLKRETDELHLLPKSLIADLNALIDKLDSELGS